MYKNILNLSLYFEWFLKKYQTLQQEIKNISAYQILEINQKSRHARFH
ncbi:MAG: hypothetical protein K0S27_1423 [Gammaproteobacteria bacterium]|jgi:hypothetical protein|nr:hypothetical protein [Gammaproteobacteria bacterium]